MIDDKLEKYYNAHKEISLRISFLNSKVYGTEYKGHPIKDYEDLSKDQINIELKTLLDRKEFIEININDEEKKRQNSKEENARRQHNFIPLIFEMLKYMSENGSLETCYQKAIEEEEEHAKKEQEKKVKK